MRGFWSCGTNCIVNVHIMDTDACTYRSRELAKVLEAHEWEKKRKHLEPCLESRHHFTPFVCSTDGLIGREAKAFLRRLAALLAHKWRQPFSQVCSYVDA